MAQTLRGTCSMGAAEIQAVNQQTINEVLTTLHRGELDGPLCAANSPLARLWLARRWIRAEVGTAASSVTQIAFKNHAEIAQPNAPHFQG